MSVFTSSEYDLDLHIYSLKEEKLKINFFFNMEKEEFSFIVENNGETREKSVKWYIHNITCQWKSLS